MNDKELKRQTVRMEEDFYKELKIALYKKDISFQKLVENFLYKWYEENK